MNKTVWTVCAVLAIAGAGSSVLHASPVTIGEALIDRPQNDSFVGNVYVQVNVPFGMDGTVTNWSFFDDDFPGGW